MDRYRGADGSTGQPQVMVCGVAKEVARERGIAEILISISHCRTYATAYAIAIARRTRASPSGNPGLIGRAGRSSSHDRCDLLHGGLAGLLGALALGVLGSSRGRSRGGRGGRSWSRRSRSQVSSTSIVFRSGPARRRAAAGASSASCSLSSSGTWAVPRHLG